MDDRNELYPFDGVVIAETGAAILFLCDDAIGEDDAVWLPKSQIEYWDGDYPDIAPSRVMHPTVGVGVPVWLAEEKGLL